MDACDQSQPVRHGKRTMRKAIVTFVYNELINLPIWRRYYGGIFGEENLFVIDHSSTDGSTADVGRINKILLAREELDEHKRCVFMASFHKSLLEYFDVAIYTDCDELIVPDLAKYRDLADYLEKMTDNYVAPVGLNVQHILNQEGPLDLSRPVLRQRRFCTFAPSMCKPLISKVPIVWATGFHACDKPINMDPNLYLFHLKQMDYGIGFHRHTLTKEMRWAESSLAANHGAHARYDYQRFVRESYLDPMNFLNKNGAVPFEFAAEIDMMKSEAVLRNGTYFPPQVPRKVTEIPEHLRGAF
jgi:hypothetical protein